MTINIIPSLGKCLLDFFMDVMTFLRHDMSTTDDQLYTPLEISHIHSPPMMLLRPTTLWKTRSGRKSFNQELVDLPDPMVFMTIVVNKSGRLSDDILCLIFLYNDHRETSVLTEPKSRQWVSPFPVLTPSLVLFPTRSDYVVHDVTLSSFSGMSNWLVV
jgi:hypothetical protein